MKTKVLKVAPVKVTNNEVFTLQQWLYECSDIKGQKFAYAILKNRVKVDAYIKALREENLTESAEFKKYDTARIKLAEKFAVKDANKAPVIANGRYTIKDQKKFDAAVKELKEKHKEAIKGREKQLKNFEKVLTQPAKIEFHKIAESELPEEITANQLSGIKVLIENGQ